MFGCVAYALVPAAKRRKFDDRTVKMRFLGYHKVHRGYKLMEHGGTRVFYRTDVTFDEYNFRLSPEQVGREVEAPTVEVDVSGSGRHSSQPVEVPADVPVEVPARQPVTPEVVAAAEEPEPEPVAENSRPIRVRKPIVRYGVEEQLNIAEEVIVKYIDSYMRSWHIYYPVVYLYISYI